MYKNDEKLHGSFLQSDRPHILMISNHGIHQWNVITGLPDTGGQVLFVNEFSHQLAGFGFRVTLINRGGYPHPSTGEKRSGLNYYNEHERILYVEDDTPEFVRKEDMHEHLPKLNEFLCEYLDSEQTAAPSLIISHYWDAAKLGLLFNETRRNPVPHIWVPHSLGALKKHNMPPESWEDLRIDERIAVEKDFVKKLDGVAATSSTIRESLKEDYGVESQLFLPPCVNTERFHPKEVAEDNEIWQFLSDSTELSVEQVRKCNIITEISRTDKTKRKDVLIRAFAKLHEKDPDTLLVVAIDPSAGPADELFQLIDELGIKSCTAAIGYEGERLPYIYSISRAYCSPSVMEGFGMAVQEAAACCTPVIGSDYIPFVEEYLVGDENKVQEVYQREDAEIPVKVGEGGIVVPGDDVEGFYKAMEMLLEDDELARRIGENAYHITIPYFTWEDMTRRFLEAINVEIPTDS